jgi:hypothetical protein
LNNSIRQRPTAMGAAVINRNKSTSEIENGDVTTRDTNGSPFS